MNYTEQLESKYPLHIIHTLRQQNGLEENDTSQDRKLLRMDRSEVFKQVLTWDGLIGYERTIKGWIEGIYGIDLDGDNIEDAKICFVKVYNEDMDKNDWIEGIVVGESRRPDSLIGFDIKTAYGIHKGCHAECVRLVQ